MFCIRGGGLVLGGRDYRVLSNWLLIFQKHSRLSFFRHFLKIKVRQNKQEESGWVLHLYNSARSALLHNCTQELPLHLTWSETLPAASHSESTCHALFKTLKATWNMPWDKHKVVGIMSNPWLHTIAPLPAAVSAKNWAPWLCWYPLLASPHQHWEIYACIKAKSACHSRIDWVYQGWENCGYHENL